MSPAFLSGMARSVLILAGISGSPWVSPASEDLMRVGSVWGWMAEPLGHDIVFLVDGTPLLMGDYSEEPSWAGVDSARVADPLSSGLWAGSEWAVEFTLLEVPDSSFRSTVGVLENTSYRNRYAASLRRPLPFGVKGFLAATRDDTLSAQRVALSLDWLTLSGNFWQRESDGYVACLEARRPLSSLPLSAAVLFARPSLSTDGLWQGRVEVSPAQPVLPGLGIEAGWAVYQDSDSTLGMDGHAVVTQRIATGVDLRAKADLYLLERDAAGGLEQELSFAAGLLLSPRDGGLWIVDRAALGAVLPRDTGGDPYAIASITAGPVVASLETEPGQEWRSRAGLTCLVSRWIRGSAAWVEDTLHCAGAILPGFTYGNARISFGASGSAALPLRERDEAGAELSPTGRLDLISMFELGDFSFLVAAEDVTDDSKRSYTYGIIWSFDDPPPDYSRGGEEER